MLAQRNLKMFIAVLGLVIPCGAQQNAQSVYTPFKILRPLGNPEIELHLAGANACEAYSIGVRASELAESRIAAAWALPSATGVMAEKSYTDASDIVSVESKGFSIDATSCAGGKSILLYLQANPSTTIRVYVDGNPVFSGKVNSGTILRNGSIEEGVVNGFPSLMVRRNAASRAIGPRQLSDGGYIVTPQMLLDNLQVKVKPQPATNGSGRPMDCQVKVQVLADGTVSEVIVREGNAEFGQHLAKAIRQWKFKPFEIDGSAKNVWGVLGFYQDASGNVRMHGHQWD